MLWLANHLRIDARVLRKLKVERFLRLVHVLALQRRELCVILAAHGAIQVVALHGHLLFERLLLKLQNLLLLVQLCPRN